MSATSSWRMYSLFLFEGSSDSGVYLSYQTVQWYWKGRGRSFPKMFWWRDLRVLVLSRRLWLSSDVMGVVSLSWSWGTLMVSDSSILNSVENMKRDCN